LFPCHLCPSVLNRVLSYISSLFNVIASGIVLYSQCIDTLLCGEYVRAVLPAFEGIDDIVTVRTRRLPPVAL
jgi:hypothetical protein